MGVTDRPVPATRGAIGIDGHDGTGKTTIAKNVAARLGMSYLRPFGGSRGQDLTRASQSGDTKEVLRIGALALEQAVRSAEDSGPVILDRSWLTVASLVDDRVFHERWTLWIPTILCWADLPTTLARLAQRDEPDESVAAHRYYIARYKELAAANGCPIVDTSQSSEAESIAEMALAVLALLNSAEL
ncbi:AAA family ATPase [Arthrobacter sp. TMN-49]